jgi:hypothetical protein
MKKFKVVSSTTVYEYTYVEAENQAEALEMAEGYTTIEPEWKEFGSEDFTIHSVEEV